MRPLEPRDGVASRPRDGVTSDVIGRLALKIPRPFPVNGVENSAPLQHVDLELEHLAGSRRNSRDHSSLLIRTLTFAKQ